MRLRPIVATFAGAALALVGLAGPAFAVVSPYDAVTTSSMNNLVTAMESYAMFDGNDLYTGITGPTLAGWGWTPPSSLAITITVEGTGASWRAVGQDIHSGAREFSYASATGFNGVGAGSIAASSPQPLMPATAAGLKIVDVGDGIDVDAMAARLAAAGVTVTQVCDFSVFVQGSHFLNTTTTDQTDACEAAAAVPGATLRSVLTRIAATAGGAAVLTAIGIEFIGDGTQTAAPPAWPTNPPVAPTPRTPPQGSLPDDVWRLGKLVAGIAALNALNNADAQMAAQQCVKYVAIAFTSADPYSTCKGTPIFMSGQIDVGAATNHDIAALAQYPAWVALNRKYPANDNSWKNSDPICQAKLTGQNCDEYPFASTQQGGGAAVPRPSLMAIDGPQNQLQGSKLGSFYSGCAIQDGDPFLAVPVPPTLPLTATVPICNK